ncbi:MAG TPA: chemotaxis response regulator protein-glutamate methylesterase [Spirochaetota bacterium]|nr:chemotaxis response regulator protein-glutamate methylesterase [Spirochaetota bacterium]HPV42165.1 chemotaxis response regulator protein-glutamate methylesterase [Spirochaetota bacterium]
MNKIKVMIVDDSAVMRKFLTESLSRSSRIEVVGTALDPYIAADKINKLRPDVLTLDIEMPRMDGITFLKKLMIASPMPVIMVSSFTDSGAKVTLQALENGAVDFILKPSIQDGAGMKDFADALTEKIIIASNSKIKRGHPAKIITENPPVSSIVVDKKYTADVILSKKDPGQIKARSEKVIAIGASTGGTEVIDEILVNLPDNLPGIVITQHMPEKFTEAFANRVNEKCSITVREAKDNDRLYKGMALIAPGGRHMLLRADANGYWVEINDGPPVNRHKPSVDVLFRSVSHVAGTSALGIICTGMGNDGAAGLLEMKQAGAVTISQDEASCVVYGMPNEAKKIGAASMERNVRGIIDYIKTFND